MPRALGQEQKVAEAPAYPNGKQRHRAARPVDKPAVAADRFGGGVGFDPH
jgi:hypothetical protein